MARAEESRLLPLPQGGVHCSGGTCSSSAARAAAAVLVGSRRHRAAAGRRRRGRLPRRARPRCRASRARSTPRRAPRSAARRPARRGQPSSSVDARDRILEVLEVADRGSPRRGSCGCARAASRCQRIANAVRGETRDASGASTELRTPALDRLLWVFLRLLLSRAGDRALPPGRRRGRHRQDRRRPQGARKKRADSVGEANQGDDRIIRSLDDSIATAELRRRTSRRRSTTPSSSRSSSIASRTRSRRSPRWRSATRIPTRCRARIDAVAEGISQTEETIRELQQITGRRRRGRRRRRSSTPT